MPIFSGGFSWKAGLIWQVGFLSATASSQDTEPYMCPAFVDTGASRTCIAQSVANDMGLAPVSKLTMETIAGPVETDLYEVALTLLTEGPDVWETVGRIMAPGIRPTHDRYQAIIGRDILRLGTLNLTPDAHFSFSY